MAFGLATAGAGEEGRERMREMQRSGGGKI
jgi:hypothetical protein